MRYWDDDSLRYIDVDVVWNGCGPSPAELHTRQCWLQREAAYATKHGSARTGEYITQAEARGVGLVDRAFGSREVAGKRCGCGRAITGMIANASRCGVCRWKGRTVAPPTQKLGVGKWPRPKRPPVTHCACGYAFTLSMQQRGFARCKTCRRQRKAA